MFHSCLMFIILISSNGVLSLGSISRTERNRIAQEIRKGDWGRWPEIATTYGLRK